MDNNRRVDANGTRTRSSTPAWLIAIVVIVALVVGAFALGLIDIDQERSAKLPEIDVQTSGGQAPSFDVDTATVDVGTKKTEVDVPTIDIDRADNPDAKD